MTQDDKKHQIWLKCMQMPNCSPQEASQFIKIAIPFLNTNITPTGQTLLMIASSVGSYFIVRECLLHGSNIDIKDSAGRNALHYAASVGNIKIFQQLVHRGSNSHEKTIGGETPLAKACIFCQGDIIQWYLNNDLSAFQITDKCDKKPLDMLKLSGEGLYEQVIEVYGELTKQQMEDEG